MSERDGIRKKITVIGGGTGPTSLLRGLVCLGGKRKFDITAIVGMSDSGGSSGRLQDELGVLPPGDVLKSLVALSAKDYARDLLQYRFEAQNARKLRGHTSGNLLLAIMAQYAGDYLTALEGMAELLDCQGRVLPASLDHATLVAETSKRMIESEGRIEDWLYDDTALAEDESLLRVFLRPVARLLPEAFAAIVDADLVVIGPGSFYTSLIAVLQVEGMREALAQAGKLAYVVNITTHPRETPEWRVSTFVNQLERHIHRPVDAIICNKSLSRHLREKYGKKRSKTVVFDIVRPFWNGRLVIASDFVPREAKLARHDPEKLARKVLTVTEFAHSRAAETAPASTSEPRVVAAHVRG